MKKILILTHLPLDKAPRPIRQIKWYKDKYEVHSVGTVPSGLESKFYLFRKHNKFYRIIRLIFLLFHMYEKFFWDKYKKILVESIKDNYDIIVAHDEDTLPIAFAIRRKAKIILDSHEYLPEEENYLIWRLLFKGYFKNLCDRYLNAVDQMITVCESISNEYEVNFGVKSIVITNAREYEELKPNPCKDVIRIVHHGIASHSRKLELMIEMMEHLDQNYFLDLYLDAKDFDNMYLNKIKELAKPNKRIIFNNHVPYSDIVKTLNKYDIGIFLLPPTNFSLKYALPNKFFEFIQARLALAIGPSYEMAKYVKKYDLGIISGDFDPLNMATSIMSNVNKIDYYKSNSDKVARILSAESNKILFDRFLEGR